MLLSKHFRHRVVVALVGAISFAALAEVTILDSKYAARQALERAETGIPSLGTRLRFRATAYCKGTTTASGVQVRTGIAAADPALLPVGSVVQVDRVGQQYNGIYTILDTGPKVVGRRIDVYMWSCHEALRFGEKQIMLTVLRLGWNPKASEPRLIDSLFRRRERELPLRSRPLPIDPAASLK
jgi:3D (Asp-Asp-Asp) domain-containing protein